MQRRQVAILDPSFFAYKLALPLFVESALWKDYRIVIPTRLYEAIRETSYENFANLSMLWEEHQPKQLEEVWSDIKSLRDQILRTFAPAQTIAEELTAEKRELFFRIDKAININQRESAIDWMAMDVAREIVSTSCVTSPIFSVSDKAKKWYSKLNSTVVKRVEENRTIMKVKEDHRERIRKAGWKGSFLVWLAKHLPIPIPNYSDIVDVVCVVYADGTHRCQLCGKSLWRLPVDIKFCPYCSSPLP